MLTAEATRLITHELQQSDPWRMGSNPYDKKRHETMLKLLKRLAPFRSALEVGCAAGLFTEVLAPFCQRLTVLDVIPKAIERCRERIADRSNTQFICDDVAEAGGAVPGHYDLIVAAECLYYFDSPNSLQRAIENLCRWLAPGGYLLFALVNDEVAARWEVTGGETIARDLSQRLQQVDCVACTGSHVDEKSLIWLFSKPIETTNQIESPLDVVHRHLYGSSDVTRQSAFECSEAIIEVAERIADSIAQGGKLLLCGNGGSAADCQHLAAEFTGRLSKDLDRPGLPALALTTDTSFLTAYSNDFGFEGVFARQVETLGKVGDVLLGISTSGNSANVIAAFKAAKQQSLVTISLSGEAGELAGIADVAISVPCSDTQHIQETHLAIEHLLCRLVEQTLYSDKPSRSLETLENQSAPKRGNLTNGSLQKDKSHPQDHKLTKSVLIHFNHGLGDAVQLTSVLCHLRHCHPDWDVDVVAGKGKHSALTGLVREVFIQERGQPDSSRYDKVYRLDWWESDRTHAAVPSTKAERCLKEVFGLEPRLDLCGYRVEISPAARKAATQYLESIGCRANEAGRYNAVVMHYEGNTSSGQKNLNHDLANLVCEKAIAAGCIPVILDWDARSPLPDNRRIFCPDKHHPLWIDYETGDAERIAALVQLSRLCVAVDSGPGHVAAATTTSTLLVWKGHHPLHFCAPSENVIHLIPQNHGGLLKPGARPEGLHLFEKAYKSRIYENLGATLLEEVGLALGEPRADSDNLQQMGKFWIRKDNAEQDMVVVRDVFEGDSYRTAIIPGIFEQAQLVVDVGAHIGCFAKRVHEMNPRVKIVCIEACPENLAALRKNVGDFAEVIHAACTYEVGELVLLNAVRPNCESTGGSVVVPADEAEKTDLRQQGYKYWLDKRLLEKITLEQVLSRTGHEKIDLLKLDCEGSEYSILGKSPSIPKVRFIVGEYHNRSKWESFRQKTLPGWDYGQMHDGGDFGGLFHYGNPSWTSGPVSDVMSRVTERSKPAISVLPVPDWYRKYFAMNEPYYKVLTELVRQVAPNRVVEFGVQAGYGAAAVFEAAPECRYLGIENDSDDPTAGAYLHALKLHAERDFEVLLLDSRQLRRIPFADLVIVDGDHSEVGCLHDLKLAAEAAPEIIVDDLAADEPVERAVKKFQKDNPGWEMSLHEVVTGRSVARLHWKSLEQGKTSRILKLALPAGIGDTLWALAKVPALLKQCGANFADITVCSDPTRRAEHFLKAFDFVRSVDYCDLSIMEQPVVVDGLYNYTPSQPNWHNRFDWLLQANGHLEQGRRLEDWMPDLEIDWDIAKRFHLTADEEQVGHSVQKDLGDFCVFYLGPLGGNTIEGHNRGPIWRPEDWRRLQQLCREAGLSVVAVGADWDRPYLERMRPLEEPFLDAIGKWKIGETYAVCKHAKFVISYQSGIGIFSVFLGVKTALWWRPQGDSISPSHHLSFNEAMASAWAPPESLKWKNYLPLIYGRHSPEQIMEHAKRHWLAPRSCC